ncbi:uncharacterized protein LOC141812477 [Curcuma longa]|uniref:uncharacterized protein LOC141812477 n=1 Tax=Curcuma longa TaxID=136217 RepID=UPI003D9F9C0E
MAPVHRGRGRGRGRRLGRSETSEEPDLIEEMDIRDQNRDIPIGGPSDQTQGITPEMPTSTPAAKSRIMTLAKAAKERFTLFHGGSDPWITRSWMENLIDTYEYMDITDAEKVGLATYHLRDEALTWWKTQRVIFGEREVTWISFRDVFEREYFPATFRRARRQEFMSLKQGGRSVTEYNAEFKKLSEFCPQLVARDEDRMDHFIQGLAAYIRDRMSGSFISSYKEALDRALAIELTRQQISKEKEAGKQNIGSKMKGQDSQSTAQKRQKTGQSSGGEFSSTSQPGRKDNRCKRCGLHGHSMADCRMDQRICYYCKNPGHMIRDCALKAQLESTGVVSSGVQPTQQQQQRPPPPQPQIYMLQGRDQPAYFTSFQHPTSSEAYYSQQYIPAVPQVYMLPSQQQYQISTSVRQSQTQTEWRPSTSQPITQPPSTEVGRVYTSTREEAQRADGSVFQGMI